MCCFSFGVGDIEEFGGEEALGFRILREQFCVEPNGNLFRMSSEKWKSPLNTNVCFSVQSHWSDM